MAKRDTRLSVDYSVDERTVIVEVLNIADRVLDKRSYALDEIPEGEGDNALQTRIALYGLNKLLTDRTSEHKDKLEKLDAMDAVFAMLKAGDWQKERQVGAIIVSAEVEALARLKGISIPVAQKALSNYDKATKAKILGNPKIVELAKEIREEREAASQAKLGDLLEYASE